MPGVACRCRGRSDNVSSFIGTKVWVRFQIDLVADGIGMTGEPDKVPPLTVVDDERTLWRAYSLVDHVADKVCAILERPTGHPSTRFKDLIDLVVISTRVSVDAAPQAEAPAREAARRKLLLPHRFDVPDRALWQTGYRAEARRTVGIRARTLDDALAVVRPFLDPLLGTTATGQWDPDHARWKPHAEARRSRFLGRYS